MTRAGSLSYWCTPAFLATSLLSTGARADVVPFDDCGILVNGTECVLFNADSGGSFVIGPADPFVPGYRVHIAGELDRSCVTTCNAGDGCISNGKLSACTTQFAAVGTLVQAIECVMFQSDGGKRYVLDNLGSFGPGDRVQVTGALMADCNTVCQQGDGCIHNNTITQVKSATDATTPIAPPDWAGLCGAGAILPLILAVAALGWPRKPR
jgi:hypothetical protein